MLKLIFFLCLCFVVFVQDVVAGNAIENLEIRWNTEQNSDRNHRSLKGQAGILPFVDSREMRKTEIAQTIKITAFEMEGSRVLDKSVLQDLLERYLGIPVSNSVLSDILNTINTYYADNAYLHSRVSIDESRIADGVVRLKAHEAKVTRLQLKGNRSIDKKMIMSKFEDPLSHPVNKYALSNAVASLKQNALISDVNAYLYPVDKNNNYALLLDIEERRKNAYVLMFNNYLSPSVGAENLRAEAMIYNKLGLGDEIRFNAGVSQGVYQFGMSYQMPLGWRGLLLSARGAYAQGKIVESVFSALDIENTTHYMDIELAKRLSWQGITNSFAAGFLWRRQSTQIAGFDWGEDKPEAGSMRLSWQGQQSHKYTSWQSNLEYVQSVYEVSQSSSLSSLLKYSLVTNYSIGLIGRDGVEFRIGGQWALNEVGSLSRMSLGGSRYLRGYRENEIQADSVLAATLEYQLPLLVEVGYIGREKILFKPFLDFATIASDEPEGNILMSAGVALSWQYKQALSLDFSFAYGFNERYTGEDDLQDYGVQFNLVYQFK